MGRRPVVTRAVVATIIDRPFLDDFLPQVPSKRRGEPVIIRSAIALNSGGGDSSSLANARVSAEIVNPPSPSRRPIQRFHPESFNVPSTEAVREL